MKEIDNSNSIPELSQKKNILGKWSTFFINRYRIAFLIVVAILIWGISAYFDLPREVQPEVVIPYGVTTTMYNGASPKDVESLITNKVEKKLDELENVKEITGVSGFGYSVVYVEFESSVDIDDMIQKMRDKVSEVQTELPDEAESPIVSSIKTNNAPIMIINLSGDYDFVQLKNIAEDIDDEINKIRGVSDVQIIGGLEREVKIIVNPQMLSKYNISLDRIKNAVSTSHINFPGGSMVLDETNYNIRTVGEYSEIEKLKNVVITYVGNSPLYLKDIAKVEDGYAKADSYSKMSSNLGTSQATSRKSVAISVKKKEEADIIKVSNKIHNLLDKSKGNLYPKNLQVEISGDMAEYVDDQLGTVINNSKSGLFLVIIVLFLFIGFFESLVVSFVIPLSIFIAFGLMRTFGLTFNTISLFSLILAVGMLVDNGIVVMENIDRLRFKGLPAKIAAEAGTNQIAPAILASTLTTIAAFYPISLTPGIMGEYIKQIPQTVIFALIASFLVAITITPALCSKALKNHRSQNNKSKHPFIEYGSKFMSIGLTFGLSLIAFSDKETGIGALSWVFAIIFSVAMTLRMFFSKSSNQNNHPFIKRYGEILYSIITNTRKKLLVIGLTVFALIMSVLLVPLGILKVEMFSPEDYDRIYVNVDAPLGTKLEDTAEITEEVESILFGVPEIESFVSNIGITGADSFDDFQTSTGATPHIAKIVIDLKDEKNRKRTSMDVAAELRTKLRRIPGANIEVQELQSGPPKVTPINVMIRGSNLDNLEMVAKDFEKLLEDVEGTRDVDSSVSEGAPELQIKINKEKAASLGLSDFDVAIQIRNIVHGLKATTFRKDQDEIDVVIRTSDKEFKSIRDLEKIYFYNRFGQPIPFNQIAQIKETKSFNTITHIDLTRQVNVTSEVEKGVLSTDIVKRFKEKIKDYDLPNDVEVKFGGEDEEIKETFTDMFENMVIAAILVFIILSVQFNSLSQPLIILFAVPMALIGVMPGLVITGNNFTFVAFVGVVALVGIAVNDAIVLVDYINYLRKTGYGLDQAIKVTGMTRFIPVLATTITTAGGILPITLKQPFFSPMGYSLIFGLCMATVLTLVVIPVLYSLLEQLKGIWNKRRGRLFKRRRDKIEKNSNISISN